jgi:Fuc2NAc and GlcNAc transferase
VAPAVIVEFAIAGLGSFGVAVGVVWLIAKNASQLGLMDAPNDRSSHASSTPRGGGVGVVAGVAAGTLLFSAFGLAPGWKLSALLVGTAAIATLGAVDDLHPLRAGYRLLVQIVVATALVIALGGVGRLPLPAPLDVPVGWAAAPMAVVWLVGVTNFYNFMDGIDGLAAGQAIASCMGIALAAWSLGAVQFAVVLAAAAAGFLVLNRAPARVFLGDVGSTSLGFAIAGLPLLAPFAQRHMAMFAVAVGLSLFLLDPIETLLRLLRSGHRIGTAHRSHSYQLLASTRDRHGTVAGGLVAAGLVLAIGGALSYREHWAAWPVAALALCAFAGERYLAGRRHVRSIADDPPAVGSSSS